MNIKVRTFLTSMLIPLFLLLNACGGSETRVAEGGITGTGITAGRITNFGSIFVNGVRFNVDNATLSRDGVNSQQSDFLVGEYVLIEGSVDASGTLGTADKVIFTDLLEGEVTAASTDGITLKVLGQNIKTDALSVFYGFANITNLSVGNVVEVSGLRESNGLIVAHSIELKQTIFTEGTSENEVKGTINSVNQTQMTFQIANITIDYSNADMSDFSGGLPEIGQFVEAKSNQSINGNTLLAFEVELEDEFPNLANNSEVDIEGLVTRFVSSTDFDVNGIKVTTNNTTRFDDGVAGNLALNVLLEVEGVVNASGTIVADRIKFKDSNNEVDIENSIQSISVQNSEIVVEGTTIIIDASTLMRDKSDQDVSPLTINDLAVGDEVKVRGFTLSNGKVTATRFERED